MLKNADEIRDIATWADELGHKYNKSISYIVNKFINAKQEVKCMEDAKKVTELDLYRESCGDDSR